MTREELRIKIVNGVDSALSHTWLISREQMSILRAFRRLALDDDVIVDKLNEIIAHQRTEGEDMPKTLTKADAAKAMQAIDWSALFVKYSPVAIAALQYLLALLAGNVPMKASCGPTDPACQEDCCQASVDASVHALYAAIQCQACCCPTPPDPTPTP